MATEDDNLLYPLPTAQTRIGGVSRVTMYRLEAKGELEFVHIGRRVFVTGDSLRAFVTRLREGAAA